MWLSVARAEVLPVHPEEVDRLLCQIRRADREEMDALNIPMRKALYDGITGSCKASKIIADGRVLAVFGDADCAEMPGVGIPWLISTVHVERNAKAFLQVCRPEVDQMLSRHRALINFVDVRNVVAVRWLKWLGFSFLDPIPYGESGELFYPFHLGAF